MKKRWHIANILQSHTDEAAHQPLPYIALLCIAVWVLFWSSGESSFSVWPPKTDSKPTRILIKELAVNPGQSFKGRGVVILGMNQQAASGWPEFGNILYYKFRPELGNDLFVDAMADDIPMINEYAHWTSPPMLALQCVAFCRPEDTLARAAHALRAFRPNLARLLGVSLAVSDKALPGEVELYHGSATGHPLFIHRILGANLGQYSPIKTAVATDAEQILDYLQAPDFDGEKLAIIEKPLDMSLVQAEQVSVSLQKGPKIRVKAYSAGTSLLVLPFEYSHCLEADGEGLDQIIPVNLAQTGLVVHGKVSLDISYHYGLLKGTSCRKQDLERIKKLQLEEAATGRLFHDDRPKKTTRKERWHVSSAD